MNDKQFWAVASKIEREYPLRKKLAAIAGLQRLDGESIVELFGWVQINAPERRGEAAALIREAMKGHQ